MQLLMCFWRLLYISYFILRYNLLEIFFDLSALKKYKIICYLNPWHYFIRSKKNCPGERLRISLEKMGPVFVKFGQLLSTRLDLLPDELSDELIKLQDKVPPFKAKIAKKIITKTYNKPIDEVFNYFDSNALASASVAQVHSARLKDDTEVVIKILRPNILKTIERDYLILGFFAKLLVLIWPDAHRLRPVEVVAEFKKTLLDELDLMREAGNASQLRRNFKDSDMLYVPEVYWDLCRKNVLVMEKVFGVPVNDIKTLKQNDVDLEKLAMNGVEIFFTQVFRDCFFHADMHPGNIFVDISSPKNPKYIAVDFGIVGTISDSDQRYLACNFHAFFKRDYHEVAKLHIESNWVPQNTSLAEFESAIRTVCEPIFEKPLKDISFAQTLLRLFQTARRFNMQVQPQLVLLQKTLLCIEGLGRELYPSLDLWQSAKPFLEKWMKKRFGPKKVIAELKAASPILIDAIPNLTQILQAQINKVNANKSPQTANNDYLLYLSRWYSMLGGVLLICSAIIFGFLFSLPFRGLSIYGFPLITTLFSLLLLIRGRNCLNKLYIRGN